MPTIAAENARKEINMDENERMGRFHARKQNEYRKRLAKMRKRSNLAAKAQRTIAMRNRKSAKLLRNRKKAERR